MKVPMCGKMHAREEFPYLDELIPSSRDDDWVLWVWRETNARDPLGVALLLDGELAVTEGVPELDGAIAGSGNDLTVVGGEGDGENITSVSDETAGGVSGSELPETEGLIPRGGKSVSSIGGDHTVGDNVRMSVERSLWDTERSSIIWSTIEPISPNPRNPSQKVLLTDPR